MEGEDGIHISSCSSRTSPASLDAVRELERAWCHPGNRDHVGLQQREPVSGIR